MEYEEVHDVFVLGIRNVLMDWLHKCDKRLILERFCTFKFFVRIQSFFVMVF